MTRRPQRTSLFVILATAVVAGYSVAETSQALWARVVGGLVAGLFLSLSVVGYLRLSKRMGLLTSAVVVALVWGVSFFLLALAAPRCPGVASSVSAGRCSLRASVSYLGIGLLTPFVFVLLFGPVVYSVRTWRRTSSFQHRHPVKAIFIALKTWAARITGRGPVPAASRPSPKLADATPASATAAAFDGPPKASAKKAAATASGVVHNKRVTSSPKHPKR